MNYNTSCIFRGFEQLFCWTSWRVIVVLSSAKNWWKGTKRVKVSFHWNQRQKLCGMFVQNKQWGYFETKMSSVGAFSRCIAHADSMCARQVITIENLCHAFEWFWWLPIFFTPKLGLAHGFFKIFVTSEDKIFETTSCQVFTTFEWLQWEWFNFEFSWWFSC